MSSILTNTSAMVALQTLKGINAGLEKTQAEISTGKSVANAKDNAAVFAISKVMESDVKGFKGISDSLSLGESTVAVARQASETVTDLLTDIKGKIVAAQEANVDRGKIQTDIVALRDQITSVVNAAQFNGLNLLSNTEAVAGSGSIDILSSLDRASDGSVTARNITVAKQDLGTAASTIGTTVVAAASDQLSGTANGTATALTGATTAPTQAVTVDSVSAGAGFTVAITGSAGNLALNTAATGDISYVARDGDTVNDVAQGLADAFNAFVAETAGADASTIAATVSNGVVTFTGSSVAGDNFSINVQEIVATENTIGGGLSALAEIDVTTDAGADAALAAIEGLTQTAINAAANFGSAQGRIEIQSDFISKLSDSLKAGIGTLVDANMEEASARLQALQVQQQLGVQALSIANQAPQNILALFR